MYFNIYIYFQFSNNWSSIVTVISISHLSSLPSVSNLKCIAWNFNGSNFVSDEDEADDLKRLRFENGDVIPDVESYFCLDE
jgi:hypothetical protein